MTHVPVSYLLGKMVSLREYGGHSFAHRSVAVSRVMVSVCGMCGCAVAFSTDEQTLDIADRAHCQARHRRPNQATWVERCAA